MIGFTPLVEGHSIPLHRRESETGEDRKWRQRERALLELEGEGRDYDYEII